jgi:hypothetical protein
LPADSDRAVLIATAQRLALASNGHPPESLSITINADQSSLTISASAAELRPAPAPNQVLTTAEEEILRVTTRQPQTAKALATLAGYTSLPHVRSAITRLCDAGLLERAGHGMYRRAADR